MLAALLAVAGVPAPLRLVDNHPQAQLHPEVSTVATAASTPLAEVKATADTSSCLRAHHESLLEDERYLHAILIPTFPPHSKYFCQQLDSLWATRAKYSEDVLVVGVFESEDVRNSILQECDSCSGTANVGLTSLLYKYAYTNTTNKFAYQSGKKLWGVAQLPEHMLVMVSDSDSLMVNPSIDINRKM